MGKQTFVHTEKNYKLNCYCFFFIFRLPDQIEWMMMLYIDQGAASIKTTSLEKTMGTGSHTEEITALYC